MKIRQTFFLLLIAGFSCGCVNLSELTQAGVQTAYYTLEYAPATITAGKLPYLLRIKRFTAAPLFSSKKIIYKQKDFQTGEYLYHQWHVVPAESIAYLLTRDIRESGLFTAVFDPSSAVPAPFTIGGNLEMFLEDNSGHHWKAILAIEIRLIDETEPDIGKCVLLQKLYTAAERCARENPRATAEAMSRAMQRLSGEIVQDVYNTLRERADRP